MCVREILPVIIYPNLSSCSLACLYGRPQRPPSEEEEEQEAHGGDAGDDAPGRGRKYHIGVSFFFFLPRLTPYHQRGRTERPLPQTNFSGLLFFFLSFLAGIAAIFTLNCFAFSSLPTIFNELGSLFFFWPSLCLQDYQVLKIGGTALNPNIKMPQTLITLKKKSGL